MLYNLARMTSATVGTGTLTLGSAVTGFLTFNDAGVPDGEVVMYAIRDGAASETGLGTYTASGTTLSRTTIYKSTNGNAAINCSGNEEVFITALAEAIGWNLSVNQSGASFTGWTGDSGTWSSDGTVIKQTNTAASFRDAYFATQQPIAPAYVLEADVKMVSAGAGSTRTVGLVIGYAGNQTSAGAAADLRLQAAARVVKIMKAFNTEIATLSYSFSDDTFYRMRLVSSGGVLSVYVNGVLIGTSGQFIDNASDARYIGLQSYGCEAHFKNIKGFCVPLPF